MVRIDSDFYIRYVDAYADLYRKNAYESNSSDYLLCLKLQSHRTIPFLFFVSVCV